MAPMCTHTAVSRKVVLQSGTMSKVIMGNGSFYGCLSEPQGVSAWWKETAQTRAFSFLVTKSPHNTHNTNRHCRVSFYTFVG